jgi:hypothetical protein
MVLLVSTNIAWLSPACVSVVDLPASGSIDVALNLKSHLQEVAGLTASGRGATGSVSLPPPAPLAPLDPLEPTVPPVPATEVSPELPLTPPLPAVLAFVPAMPVLPALAVLEPPLPVEPAAPAAPEKRGDAGLLEHAPVRVSASSENGYSVRRLMVLAEQGAASAALGSAHLRALELARAFPSTI